MMELFGCGVPRKAVGPITIHIRSTLSKNTPEVLHAPVPGDTTVDALLDTYVWPELTKGVNGHVPMTKEAVPPVVLCRSDGTVLQGWMDMAAATGVTQHLLITQGPEGPEAEERDILAKFENKLARSASGKEIALEEEASQGSCDVGIAQDETIFYLVIAPHICMMRCVSAPQLLATLHKVHILADVLGADSFPEPSTIPSAALLTYDDLRALHYACYLKDSRRLFDEQPHAEYFRLLIGLLCREFEECVELRERWFEGYKSGDVVFYDLEGREKMGDFVSETVGTSLFYYVQKKYDQYSHSGLLVMSGTSPRLFHGLANRIKVLNYPLLAVYMPRRRVDFAKVFVGFAEIPPEVQTKAFTLFSSAVHMRSVNYSMYTNSSPGFWTGLWKIFGWRLGQVTTDPELLSKRTDPDNPNASSPLCSGFTSAVLYEVLLEVQKVLLEEMPEMSERLKFTPAMHRDVLNFTPKELHGWGVWATKVEPHFFERLVTPDVAACHRALDI